MSKITEVKKDDVWHVCQSGNLSVRTILEVGLNCGLATLVYLFEQNGKKGSHVGTEDDFLDNAEVKLMARQGFVRPGADMECTFENAMRFDICDEPEWYSDPERQSTTTVALDENGELPKAEVDGRCCETCGKKVCFRSASIEEPKGFPCWTARKKGAYVDCPVTVDNNGKMVYPIPESILTELLFAAVNDPRFMGYVFEGGSCLYSAPAFFRDIDGELWYCDNKNRKLEHAKAVRYSTKAGE